MAQTLDYVSTIGRQTEWAVWSDALGEARTYRTDEQGRGLFVLRERDQWERLRWGGRFDLSEMTEIQRSVWLRRWARDWDQVW